MVRRKNWVDDIIDGGHSDGDTSRRTPEDDFIDAPFGWEKHVDDEDESLSAPPRRTHVRTSDDGEGGDLVEKAFGAAKYGIGKAGKGLGDISKRIAEYNVGARERVLKERQEAAQKAMQRDLQHDVEMAEAHGYVSDSGKSWAQIAAEKELAESRK